MYTNKIAALAGAVAFINHVAALNINRREHKLEKKEDVIVWKTVYVNEDGSKHDGPPPTGAAKFADVVVSTTQAPKNEPPPVQKDQAPVPAISKPSVKPATPAGTGSTVVSSKKPGFSGKRGIAYNDPRLANLVGSSCKKSSCGWAYNWGQVPGDLDSKIDFVPMLWGPGPHNENTQFFDSWSSSASKAVANGAKALLSFNEPDNKGQASMTPGEAAKYQVKYMNPYHGKTLIGAPAVTNSNNKGEGLEWLESFVQECKTQNCAIDFVVLHWYDRLSASATLLETIEKAHKISDGKPVWLTEFALVDATPAQTAEFLGDVIPKLEALEYLDAYAYFMAGADTNQLLSSESALSRIGAKYVSL